MRDRDRIIAALLVALAACGGGKANNADVDAGPAGDGGNPDAAGMPMPPALGAQLDRMGRPGVAELLVAPFGGADAADRQAAYRQAADPAAWKTTQLATNVTVESEFKTNLGPLDAIDNGFVANQTTFPGCGNALFYLPPVTATSYLGLADVLADDQLYLDTSKPTCAVYLALEIEQASTLTILHTTCGGRTLRYDALDVLVSVLAAGLAGVQSRGEAIPFAPRLNSKLAAHTDVSDSFPFLGAPNP
jgi:hypothetical protein